MFKAIDDFCVVNVDGEAKRGGLASSLRSSEDTIQQGECARMQANFGNNLLLYR